ncbi:MAG TPA: hypothetical protein VHH88_09090 [Verrucomicrobiae bacterium]|nr:hypothetical protein [Verrucomicrobiae bacterium]
MLQSMHMDTDWAADHLRVIRTLMERSALYRRALAPIMTWNGAVGLCAAGIGRGARIETARAFVLFWACVALMAIAGSFLMVRRQALKDAEPFWSPPTRRVSLAALPALIAGAFITVVFWIRTQSLPPGLGDSLHMLWIEEWWLVLYGCALHAAGAFMPRSVRLFAWVFIVAGSALLALGFPDWARPPGCAHTIMGASFGLLQLAYGIYLYFTEPRGKEA